jgi:hypothetical protein
MWNIALACVELLRSCPWLCLGPGLSCSPVITAPTNGSTVKGVATFTVNPKSPGGLNFFTRLYIDRTHFDFTGKSTPEDSMALRVRLQFSGIRQPEQSSTAYDLS